MYVPGIHCRNLTHPQHTEITSDPGAIAGSVVRYRCREGFRLTNGSLELVCNLDGRWSADPPQCTVIICPAPEYPSFTEVDVNATSYAYSTTVTYSCMTGFDLIAGDTERMCLANREWSGIKPLCRIVSCGSLAPVAHAFYVVPEETIYMTTITYDCQEGYKRGVGNWTRTCLENKQWTGIPPMCEEIKCPNPPEVNYTLLDVSGLRMNEYAFYACIDGFRLKRGNLTKRCNKEAAWEGTDPVCVEIMCGEPRQIEHSKIRVTGRKLNSKAIYTCETDYEQESGNNTAVCRESGHWSDVTIVCRDVTCGAPPQPLHALVEESGKGTNGRADYVCEKGYRLTSGTTRSSCTTQGQWTDVTIKCQPITCPVIPTAHVVIVNQTGDQLDDSMTLECESGYRYVSGSIIRTCLWTRDWSGVPTTCKEMLCNKPMPVLGAAVSHPSLSVNASATYLCSPGYRAAGGDFSRVCQVDGTWSGQRPLCEDTCPENSKLLVISGRLTPGSLTTFRCTPGYTIATGSNETRCTPEGRWDSPLPQCRKIDCGTPPAVSNAHTDNLTATTFMATAQYVCDEGYKADVIGAPLVCGKSASWLGEPVVCSEIQCAVPALPVNTYVEAKSLNYKSAIVYKCHKGFAMTSGDKRRTCQSDGSWNGTEPTCAIMRCSDPPAVANTTWFVDKKSFEQRVIYKCLPRFELVSGELAKVCSSDLQWTGEDPVCVESSGTWVYVIKEDEPKTPKEKMMAKFGYKKSDEKVGHVAIGVVASVVLVLSIAVVVALDGPLLIAHLKMMRRNVSYGMTRLRGRGTVSPERHHAPVDGP
ncbi:Sushi, von Willebrand factor type A, EGF and pentraxin domain-containing protein 1 [Lamellibrachia satsuma]|nr:Sushi, von Willebrand factor type A, EGF and pentraxin domain-containing protein 1 [Lamellibrachia satsuma]